MGSGVGLELLDQRGKSGPIAVRLRGFAYATARGPTVRLSKSRLTTTVDDPMSDLDSASMCCREHASDGNEGDVGLHLEMEVCCVV